MPERTIRLTSDDQRWLEMTVDRNRATARVGQGKPFPFNFEHLGFVAYGMAYQAWGSGSHFIFRKAGRGFATEFQGPHDRSPAVCYLSDSELESILSELAPHTSRKTRARML